MCAAVHRRFTLVHRSIVAGWSTLSSQTRRKEASTSESDSSAGSADVLVGHTRLIRSSRLWVCHLLPACIVLRRIVYIYSRFLIFILIYFEFQFEFVIWICDMAYGYGISISICLCIFNMNIDIRIVIVWLRLYRDLAWWGYSQSH